MQDPKPAAPDSKPPRRRRHWEDTAEFKQLRRAERFRRARNVVVGILILLAFGWLTFLVLDQISGPPRKPAEASNR